MELREILRRCDHTLLRQTATWDEIRDLCDEGLRWGVASVCIPPCHVRRAAEYLEGKLPVCTVIGFPNGSHSSAVKCFEAERAMEDGASELDVVANLGLLRAGEDADVLEELLALRRLSRGRVLKVIIETCLLTEEEKKRMCRIVSRSGADYIKTSTGFSTGGATREDVALLRAHVAPAVKVKAAGGIATLQDAEDFIRLGAERLGTSRLIRLATALEGQ